MLRNKDRIAAEGFVVQEEDAIHCPGLLREGGASNAVQQLRFDVEGVPHLMVNAMPMRSERKKWLPFFEGFELVIMLLSGQVMETGDQMLYEDENVARMHEARMLTDEICNSKWFRADTTRFLVLMDVDDHTRAQLREQDFQRLFYDYQGGPDENNALQYLEARFLRLEREPRRDRVRCLTLALAEEGALDRVFAIE